MKRKPNPILPVIERLERNLEILQFYCSPGVLPGVVAANPFMISSILRGIFGSHELGYWPSYELLREIEDDVTVLAERGRVRQIFPCWKAFEQLDKRLTKLRLKLRVDNLIGRASKLLSDESQLAKALAVATTGNALAQRSLNAASGPESISAAAKTAAQKHYELLQAHGQMERQRCMAQPVATWTVSIGHPMAKDFVCIAGFDPPGQDWRDSHRRILLWDRVRRHRLAKKHL
jgi:hypothetical protein